jgi:hypothetical protein
MHKNGKIKIPVKDHGFLAQIETYNFATLHLRFLKKMVFMAPIVSKEIAG